MLRWERVPILGNNPVFCFEDSARRPTRCSRSSLLRRPPAPRRAHLHRFRVAHRAMANCFEARRLWTRRTLLVLVLVTLAIAVVAPALGLVSRYVLRHPPGPMFLRFASRLALVAFPPRVHAVELVLGEVILFTPHAAYVLTSVLAWLAILGGRYFLPALAALSVAGDRASGRLGRLLGSGMALRQIMLGKLLALVVPRCTLMLCGTAVLGPMLIKEGTHDLPLILWGLLDTAALFLGSIIGLWVGHATRKPAVAAGMSVFCAGVWFAAKCALSEGAEWRIHAAAHSSLTTPTPGQTRRIAVIDPAGGSHVIVRAYNADPVRLRL